MRRLLAICLLLVGAAMAEQRWLPATPARVRALGGCFAALSTPEDAQFYNPAGLAIFGQRPALKAVLDVSALRIRPRKQAEDWNWAGALPALLPLRRLEWRGRHLAVALSPADWHPAATSTLARAVDEARPLSGELAPSLSAALALDHRVRLGVTATALLDASHKRRRVGVSYGAVIRANKIMDVGGQAVYLPVGALESRRPLDQLGDGTINVGIACYPWGRDERGRRGPLLLALDVRNVTQESGLSKRQELHLGLESRLPVGLDLRGGVYWPNSSPDSPGFPCVGGGLGWNLNLPLGGLSLDLAWLQDPARRGDHIWTGGLRWPR
jgi:hypothetical protein